MVGIIVGFFLFFLLIVGILSIFIVYHLKRYNTNPILAQAQIIVYLVVTTLLVGVSFTFFVALPFEDIALRIPLSFPDTY